jgi:ribosome-associated protein
MEQEYKSRTQIKNEMKALQELGVTVGRIFPEARNRLTCRKLTRSGCCLRKKTLPRTEALRRQLQYIGGLMRTVTGAIRGRLAMRDNRQQAATQAMHHLKPARPLIAGQVRSD